MDITSRLVIIYLGWQDLAQDWLIRSYLSANQVSKYTVRLFSVINHSLCFMLYYVSNLLKCFPSGKIEF